MSSCVLPISPPLESPYFNEDSFPILEGEINHFQAQGHVLVCGYLHARTGQEPDTLTQGDKHLPGGDRIPSPICPLNYDNITNKTGHNSCSSVTCSICTVVAKGFENDRNINFHKVCCLSFFRYFCQMLLWNTDV
jgi:hypothetical protein